jgi:hypothetical protein
MRIFSELRFANDTWFDVTMDNVLGVHVLSRVQQLPNDGNDLLIGVRLGHECLEGLTLNELSDEVELAIGFTGLMFRN